VMAGKPPTLLKTTSNSMVPFSKRALEPRRASMRVEKPRARARKRMAANDDAPGRFSDDRALATRTDSKLDTSQQLRIERHYDGAQGNESRPHRGLQQHPPRGQPARGQWNRDDVVSGRPPQILQHLAIGGLAEGDDARGVARIASHEDDVSRLDR